MNRAVVVFVPLALAFAFAGCTLFMDLGTSGYTRADAGTDGGTCTADAECAMPTFGCISTADCDAGQVCCLDTNGLTSQANAACQTGPCGGLLPIQLCKTSMECTGVSCVLQTCSVEMNATIQACGNIPTCTAVQ